MHICNRIFRCMIFALVLAATAFAEPGAIIVGTSSGDIHVVDQVDLSTKSSIVAYYENAARPVSALTVNENTGDIVAGLAGNGHGLLVSWNIINVHRSISNAIAFASDVESLDVDSNGNLLAGGTDATQPIVMHRMIPHVDSYTMDSAYAYPPIISLGQPVGTALVAADTRGKFYVAIEETGVIYYRLLDWSLPTLSHQLTAGGQVNAITTTARGYLVYGMEDGSVHIRGNASAWMDAAPSGYVETTGPLGSPVTALAVAPGDKVITGLADGRISIRAANSLDTVIDSIDFGVGSGIVGLSATSDGYILIATNNNGELHVRSLSDMHTPVASRQFGNTITAIASCPLLIPADCSQAADAGLTIAADINKDCRVDLADLSVIIQNWMMCMAPYDQDCQ